MRLQDALDKIDELDDDHVIFARRPWVLESDAETGPLEPGGRVPNTMASRGMEYFLEVSVAKEVLEALGERKPTLEQQRSLLMYYAEHDAYPQWIYHR